MALTKITTSVVAVNSLTAANIADNSIDATKIANNQILARHIAAGALTDQLGTLTSAIDAGSNNITTTGVVTGGSFNVGGTNVIDTSRNLVNMGNVNGAAGIFGSLTVDTNTLHVDSANNRVGIGTASPASALHISGGDNTAAKLTITNTANTNTYSIHAQNNSQTLHFQEDGTNVMSLATGGKLGIGTTSPNYTLGIHKESSDANYIQITNSTTGSGSGDGALVGLGSDESLNIWHFESEKIAFGTNNQTRMIINSSGELFLNSTSAMNACFTTLRDHSDGEAFLGVEAKDDSNVGIRLGHGGTEKWVWYSDPSDNLIWYSNADGAERMRITDATGAVSLGHIHPSTAGTYTVNHLGVYSGGVTLNAATSQTGWLMSAGTGKLSWSPSGAMAGTNGLGFHSTMDNRIETDQTTATRMKFYLNDIAAGEWKRTGSGGSIRPNQYSSGDTAATLPALASYDDENTGVYFPAADSIGISVGGSQAMLFDDDKFATIGSESGIPNSLAGLQIKRGGLLINGTSNTTNFHTVSFLSNYWTYFGSGGASGSYSGSFRVSVPSPTGPVGNAWGGFQLEIYISGYNTKYCHAMLSGYTNGGVTLSEATIIRSSGSHSVSYGSYHTGGSSNQGFYFDIDIPGYTHPSAFYRVTKGGDTSSDHETALGRDLVAAWS